MPRTLLSDDEVKMSDSEEQLPMSGEGAAAAAAGTVGVKELAAAIAKAVRPVQPLPKLGEPSSDGRVPKVNVPAFRAFMQAVRMRGRAAACNWDEDADDMWETVVLAIFGNYHDMLAAHLTTAQLHVRPRAVTSVEKLNDFLCDVFFPTKETRAQRNTRIRTAAQLGRGTTVDDFISKFQGALANTPPHSKSELNMAEQKQLLEDALAATHEGQAVLSKLTLLKQAGFRDNDEDTLGDMFDALRKTTAALGIVGVAAPAAAYDGPVPMDVSAVGARNQERGRQGGERRSCYKCGRQGHLKADCPDTSARGISCYTCGGPHLARNCSRQGGGKQGRGGKPARGARVFAVEAEGEDDDDVDVDAGTQVKNRRAYLSKSQSRGGGGSRGKGVGGGKRMHHSTTTTADTITTTDADTRAAHNNTAAGKKRKRQQDEARTEEQRAAAEAEAEETTGMVIDPDPSNEKYGNMTYMGTIVGRGGERRRVKVLVDTGASRNMISTRLTGVTTCVPTGQQKTRFRFANGTLFVSDKRCPQVELHIQRYSAKIDLLVCELQNVDIILGREWLGDNNVQIDTRTGTITLEGEPTDPIDEVEADGEADGATGAARPVDVQVVSAGQLKRLLRRGGDERVVATAIIALREGLEDSEADINAVGADSITEGPPGVDSETPAAVAQVVGGFRDLFTKPDGLPPARPDHDHRIVLTAGARPPFKYPFRLSLEERKELEKQLAELLEKGHIVPSNSPFGAPVLFARKKDGGLRLCIDYRALNKITVRDRYPLPHIGDLLDRLGDACIFSKMDCRSGYHQVRVQEEDSHKTTFVTHKGSFEWRVLPMGLTNAPATFQRLMNDVLRPFADFCVVYLDDILIFSNTEEEHAGHVRRVLEALRKNTLRLHPEKCYFGRQEIGFLGYVIAPGVIKMEHSKVEAVRNWDIPRTKGQLMEFLGFVNFYSDHIEGFAHKAAPLTDLLANTTAHAALPQPLPTEAVAAFQKLKKAVCEEPVLRMADERRDFVVCTDASDKAIGCVLMQRFHDGEHPVEYKSRKLASTEQGYCAREKELLAVIYALNTWRHYLANKKFVLRTDHESLQYLDTMKLTMAGPQGKRLLHWSQLLQEFDMDVQYVKGKDNVADALSRNEAAPVEAPSPAEACAITETSADMVNVPGTSEANLRADDYFGPVVRIIKDNDKGTATPAQLQRAKWFRWVDGKLYKAEGGEERMRVCVAGKEAQKRLVREYHSSRLAGHPGHERTLASLSGDFFWRKMGAMVQREVRACVACQRNKANNQPTTTWTPIDPPEGPGQCVTIDFAEMPPTERGHDYMLVCVDKFSKLVRVAATDKTVDAARAADIVLNLTLTSSARLPTTIISDRDPRFTAELWGKIWAKCGVELHMTTAHRPQADGQSERAVRMVREYLRCFSTSEGTDWDTVANLTMLEFAINSHVSESTKTTPFELHYGRKAVMPARLLDPPAGSDDIPWQARARVARDAMHEAQEKMVAAHGSVAPTQRFKAGDRVLLDTNKYPRLRRHRNDDRFFGPLRVKEVPHDSPNVVVLGLPAAWQINPTVNVDCLKPFVETPGVEPQMKPLRDDLYYVEKLLDVKGKIKQRKYLVKWLHYAEDQSTWEPEENIPKAFILQFWRDREQGGDGGAKGK